MTNEQAFITNVAKTLLKELSEEDRDYLYWHPSSSDHHFHLGLWIRNHYIYRQETGLEDMDADDLSASITRKMASLIIENYDYENLFYYLLYEDYGFNYMRRLYFALTGEHTDHLVDPYADKPDCLDAVEEAQRQVRSAVLNEERFWRLGRQYGLAVEQAEEYKEFIDSYNEEHRSIVPYDVALLASPKAEPEQRATWLHILKAVLDQTSGLALELPALIFNQKDAVLLAVGARGDSLARFSDFQADEEVIRTALAENGEAIQSVREDLRDREEYVKLALSDPYNNALKMDCMAKYRDQEEFVKIALAANGCNIEYASERLRDDLEIARFAVTHQTRWYPESTVCNLSERLRDNLEIALLDIREGNVCVSSYSKRLRDCDEVAEALISAGEKWRLYEMSERIQKKYKDEIEE